MEPHEIAWLIRYVILSAAELCSLLVILAVIVGRLYRYTSCLIIFLMQVCYAIVNANALLYTDRFSQLNNPFITDNPFTEEQPWNTLCQVQSYLIHACWMASFFLSLILVTFEYWILSNKFGGSALKNKLLLLCFLVPIVITAAPFFYQEFGFGPNGFNIPTTKGWESVYFFCGWKSPLVDKEDLGKRIRQQLAYGLNFMLPLFVGLVYELYLLVRIRRVRQIYLEEGITISKEQQYITKLHKIPFYLFIILLVNMVVRLLPVVSESSPVPIRYIILMWDFAFDVIPVLSSYQFFRFVRTSLTVPRLSWLGRPQTHVSLMTERSESAGPSSEATVTSN